MVRDADKKPGLPAIHAGRDARQRGRYTRPSVNLLIYVVAGAAAVLLGYRFFWGRQLDSGRDGLLAQQRAAVATVGKEWHAFRDQLETIALEAANSSAAGAADTVLPEARMWDFRGRPGVYLRVRTADARTTTELRKAVPYSVRDAFTGCLLREANPQLAQGLADAGESAEQPWNLKQAYQATRVLTDEWQAEVRNASDDMRLRVFQDQYERAKRDEIPLAIDILKKAEFFLLVLDDDVADAQPSGDAGLRTEDLMLVKHPTRIWIADLRRKTTLVRLTRSVDADYRVASGATTHAEEIEQAMRRQVNNCALGNEVWRSITGAGGH
jgi:hypothetical protein